MNHRHLILFILCLPLLYGCSLSSVATQTFYSSDITQAENYVRQGKHSQAAQIYQRLAQKQTPQQNQFRLLAADAFIQAGNIDQGAVYVQLINNNLLTKQQRNHLKLLQAQLDLNAGYAEMALSQLLSMQIAALDNPSRIAYYKSLAFAYTLTNKPLRSTQALINIDPYLHRTADLHKHYRTILETLNSVSAHDLHIKQPLGAKKLSGWMALARLFKLHHVNINQSLSKWRKLYPYHPANSDFLLTYQKEYQAAAVKRQPSTIAVFLPRSGRYANAARVIKTGFNRAYELARQSGQAKAAVRFYDTESGSLANLYQQAMTDGAQLIVGPLDKNNIKLLVNNVELSVPVIALNHVERLNHPNLYQFGLSPIDDAQQIAYKAQRDGYQNAALLIPKTRKGDRIADYLTQHWQRLGGDINHIAAYDRAETDFNKVIQRLLSGNNAEVDVIFVNAYAKQASSLNPQLQFNHASADLPVYATSQVYLGSVNSRRDKDLNGITFCDVPWVFERVYAGVLTKTAMQSSWSELPPSYLRLLPLGIDAYNLTNHITELSYSSYVGATGKLSLDDDNRVMRELFCAKFVNGIPELINYTSETGAPELQPLPFVEAIEEVIEPTESLEEVTIPAPKKIVPGAQIPDAQIPVHRSKIIEPEQPDVTAPQYNQ
ncbi:MAG: penicillin-binding protein activator [Methylococcales bacterium]|nr:penicillin-binding protein activator [Methylococcales bacterium]